MRNRFSSAKWRSACWTRWSKHTKSYHNFSILAVRIILVAFGVKKKHFSMVYAIVLELSLFTKRHCHSAVLMSMAYSPIYYMSEEFSTQAKYNTGDHQRCWCMILLNMMHQNKYQSLYNDYHDKACFHLKNIYIYTSK